MRIYVILLLFIVFVVYFVVHVIGNMRDSTLPGFTIATVTRVIDGDTIVLSCGERVRLIGIDAPEIGESGDDEASEFVKKHVYRQRVWLSSSGADRDRFGRLRRYVWIKEPTDPQDPVQIAEKQLNALLVEHGHAIAVSF